jgi:hypothetical protein
VPNGDNKKNELTENAEIRAFARLHESHQGYQDLVRLAARLRRDMQLDTKLIDGVLDQAQKEFERIAAGAGGRIIRRAHPEVDSDRTCTVSVDECGQHELNAKDNYKTFGLGAAIVRDEDWLLFDAKWREWKRTFLGSAEKLVHEPNVRKRNGSFWFGGDKTLGNNAVAALPQIIRDLPFTGVVCIIHREKYLEKYGGESPNVTLPRHAYLMALHFLAERIALALQHSFGGAKARLIFESRGPKEDALLQYEFARLFLDGTAYLSAAYFRHQFFPGLAFKSKDDNDSGLQIADLLVRPCADKALAPESEPERWEAFRSKLCSGRKTENSIIGLKVMPWDACYECMLPEGA